MIELAPDGTVIDREAEALHRLLVLPPPSAYAVACTNRRDVIGDEARRMQVDAARALVRRRIRVRLAWTTRRLRRQLGARR